MNMDITTTIIIKKGIKNEKELVRHSFFDSINAMMIKLFKQTNIFYHEDRSV